MHDTNKANPPNLVGSSTTESHRVLGGRADGGLVVVCDHANNAFPPGYGTLGLASDQLVRHIAYDIGAAEVTRRISEALNAPALMTHYSRLVIDPNRGSDDPTLIMRISDGAVVPGNRDLTFEERDKRVFRFYEPYHAAIDHVLDTCVSAGVVPVLLSVHSFTNQWRGIERPWHAAILWDQDPRLAVPLLEHLRVPGDILVGDNEPYTGRLKGDCMWRHGTMRGIAHAIVELRQDLIREEHGQALWADRLIGILRELLSSETFKGEAQKVEFYVSNDDISSTTT